MTARRAPSDITVIQRAGRMAALQASLALAAVLLVVGAVLFVVDVRVQNRQIAAQLASVAASADDVTDPPPGMIIGLRDRNGHISVAEHPEEMSRLLEGPAGYSDVTVGGLHYRAYVTDERDGRVAAALDLQPYEDGRSQLLLALGIAGLAGILASVAVVILLSRRSIRPLAQALDLQRRFVADASHELRAPLTVLHTRAQLLARRSAGATTPQQAKQIDALIADTRALGEVIEDLLASASMNAADAPRDRVDVSRIAVEVAESFAEVAASAGVVLSCEVSQEPGADFVVLGSAAALRRALSALVDNALAHERPGGVVVLEVTRSPGGVAVAVRDDGVGVDPAAAEEVFARFAHGDGHTSVTGRRRYGIGLALVREIAQAHGGDINLTQTPGGGATFTLIIPAAMVAGAAARRRLRRYRAVGQSHTDMSSGA